MWSTPDCTLWRFRQRDERLVGACPLAFNISWRKKRGIREGPEVVDINRSNSAAVVPAGMILDLLWRRSSYGPWRRSEGAGKAGGVSGQSTDTDVAPAEPRSPLDFEIKEAGVRDCTAAEPPSSTAGSELRAPEERSAAEGATPIPTPAT